MDSREKLALASPTAAALWLTSRIKPARLGHRVASQLEDSDFRGATLLCRRALSADRANSASGTSMGPESDQEQRYWLRQLLSLVDDLRIEQRRRPQPKSA